MKSRTVYRDNRRLICCFENQILLRNRCKVTILFPRVFWRQNYKKNRYFQLRQGWFVERLTLSKSICFCTISFLSSRRHRLHDNKLFFLSTDDPWTGNYLIAVAYKSADLKIRCLPEFDKIIGKVTTTMLLS